MTKPICHINLATKMRGGASQTEMLIRGISTWNVEQRLVAAKDSMLAARLEDCEHLEIVTVPDHAQTAAKAARGSRFVHAHDATGLKAAQRARFFYGVPYLVTYRDSVPPPGSWLTHRSFRKAEVVVAISKAVRRVLSTWDKRLTPEVVNSCASVYRSFPTTSDTLANRYQDKFVVGHIGALHDASKGQSDLIEVARSMSRTHPDVLFMLIGSGPDEAQFKQAAQGLSNVEVIGHVANVGDYLKVMSVFAFPSRIEGLGSTLLDAMDYSLPIVATAVGGIPELVQDNVNGLLVTSGNTDQLAFALQRLYSDPALRKKFGDKGHSRVQKHTPDAMVERYLEIYQQYLPQDS